MAEKPIVIKLSPEQIIEKEIQLFKTNMQLEMVELNIKQYERALKEGIPAKENAMQLNNFKKQMEMLKHNVIALEEQIAKKEM
jgi:hypothetical protein